MTLSRNKFFILIFSNFQKAIEIEFQVCVKNLTAYVYIFDKGQIPPVLLSSNFPTPLMFMFV